MNYLENSGEGKNRRYARLRLEVEEILRREIAKVAEKAWDNQISAHILDDLSNRKSDPYRVSEEILSKILSSYK